MLRKKTQDYLKKMYELNLAEDLSGKDFRIDQLTRISPEQGNALFQIAQQPNVNSCLEIGLAYGFSTIHILEGLVGKSGANHTAIDPFADEYWGGVGLRAVQNLGFHNFQWIKDLSIHAITNFIKVKQKFDYIYIDGNHRFDDILVDFYLSDQVLNINGFLILDDMWMKSSQLVKKFISTNREYEEIKTNIENIAVFKKRLDDSRNWDHWVDFT
jgi:predicted O-methyltransferase YrrM